MSQEFDPYRKWLGIPPKDQPPNHYRLLGIPLFEDDHDVIENAADRQMAHVRTYSSGPHAKHSQRILNELAAAKVCLLDPEKKREYDQELRAATQSAPPPPAPIPTPPPPKALPAEGPPPPLPAEEFPAAEPLSGDYTEHVAQVRAAVANEPAPPRTIPQVGPKASPQPVQVATAAPRLSGAAASTRVRARKSNPMPMLITAVGVVIGFLVLLLVLFNSGVFDSQQAPAPRGGQAGLPSPGNTPSSLPRPGSGNTGAGGTQTPNPPRTQDPPSSLPRVDIPEPAPPVDRRKQVQDALTSARLAASQRDLDAAKRHLLAAESAVSTTQTEELQQITQLQTLIAYLGEFWNGVRQGIYTNTEVDEEFTFDNRRYQLLGREGNVVRYRVDGEERKHEISKLPALDAMAFASRTLKAEDTFTFIYAGTFFAFEGNRRIARESWERAASLGVRNRFLAEELQIDVAGLRPVGGETDRPTETPVPLPPPGGETRPNDPTRRPVPAEAELIEARVRFRNAYGDEVNRAKSTELRAELAKRLISEAAEEQNSALRYVLWEQVRDQLINIPNVEGLLAAIDEMGADFQIDPLHEKQVYLGKIQARSTEDNMAVLQAALALFAEARLRKAYDDAQALGKLAELKARGLRNFDEMRRIQDLLKEVTAEQAGNSP